MEVPGILDFIAIVVSLFALYFTYTNNKQNQDNNRESFINQLRSHIKNVKYAIWELEYKPYSPAEKMLISEPIRDALMYLGYKREKEKCLNHEQARALSKLQEDIDDCLELIFANTDIATSKERANSDLNNFLKLL